MARIQNWTRMKSAELWDTWRLQFQDDEEAIVTAIWIANRLVKGKAPSTRRKFYSIKDEFILRNQHCLIEGRKAREEYSTCWQCEGTGTANAGGPQSRDCVACGGTGKHRPRWLYVHSFGFAGQAYTFHSYARPDILSDVPGEDLEHYGGRFSEEELTAMSLPMTGLLRVLGYVACTTWGMQFITDRYYNEARIMAEDFGTPVETQT